MIDPPKSRAEAEKLHYGDSLVGGNRPNYRPERCAYEVSVDEGRWTSFHQCYRKPGFGPNKIFCKFHSPEQFAERNKRQEEKWKAAGRPRDEKYKQQELTSKKAALLDDAVKALNFKIKEPHQRGCVCVCCEDANDVLARAEKLGVKP